MKPRLKPLESAARFAPRLADLYMKRWTFDAQRTDQPVNDRAHNLYEPVAADGVERGRNWAGHTRKSSIYTRAALHPRKTAAVIAVVVLDLGVAAAARRAGRSPEHHLGRVNRP